MEQVGETAGCFNCRKFKFAIKRGIPKYGYVNISRHVFNKAKS